MTMPIHPAPLPVRLLGAALFLLLLSAWLHAAPPAAGSGDLERARNELREAEKRVAAAELKLKRFDRNLATIEHRLKELPTAIRQEQQRLQASSAELARAEQHYAEGTGRLKELETAAAELTREAATAKSAAAAAERAVMTARDRAVERFRTSEAFVALHQALELTQRERDAAVAAVTARLEQTPAFAALQQAHAAAQAEMAERRQTNPHDSNAMAAAEARIADTFARLGRMRDQALRDDPAVQAAEATFNQNRTAAAALERDFAERQLPHDEPYRAARAANEEAQRQVAAITAEQGKADTARRRTAADLAKVKAAGNALVLEVRNSEVRLAQLEASEDHLEVDRRAAERKVERARDDVRDARRDLEKARARLRDLEGRSAR